MGGLTLENLLGAPAQKPPKKKKEKVKVKAKVKAPSNGVKRRTLELCKYIDVGPQEIRDAHLKTAVFPSEKPELEKMVHVVHHCSVSDFLRDFLIREYDKAKREGTI